MFPSIEPYEHGLLAASDSQQIYWECSGNPKGIPVVYLHGGPGSGCSPRNRRLFDPALYRIVLTDQRGCGRSRPLVETAADLDVNTTQHLIADLELLRRQLAIERWTVVGGSWGTTLALAYAQAHPHRVIAIVLASVTTSSRREVLWITNGVGRIFPEQWERFAAVAQGDPDRELQLPAIYNALLFHDDAALRARAAREWRIWEDAHVSLAPAYAPNRRVEDPAFCLLFARMVTHYWKHAAFLEEDQLIRDVSVLEGIPGVLIHGRYDVSSPLETAWRLHKSWAGSELHALHDSGHGGGSMVAALVAAINPLGAPLGP
ncbi:MAG TPA: prolyl aminopeptidase [Candidatus Cybelea sp.]